MAKTIMRVRAPHYCACLIHDGHKVTEAAPILRWGMGKTPPYLRGYFKRKGFEVEEFPFPVVKHA